MRAKTMFTEQSMMIVVPAGKGQCSSIITPSRDKQGLACARVAADTRHMDSL